MESFIQIIQLLRWPITLIIILCIFRRPLTGLIPKIRAIKYKDFEAEFSEKLENLKKDANNLPCSLNVAVSDLTNLKKATLEEVLESGGLDFYAKLAKIDPRSAVIKAWRILELAIYKKANMPGRRQNIRKAVEVLEKERLIDSGEKHILYELRMMRNQAVHASSFELTFLDAIEYAELANRLTCYIQDRDKL